MQSRTPCHICLVSISSPSNEGGGQAKKVKKVLNTKIVSISSPSNEGGGTQCRPSYVKDDNFCFH